MGIFNSVSLPRPSSSTFDLSHDRKFSLNMGDLVPILCEEIVPGDKWTLSSQQMLRFAPLISPVMHEVNVFTHYFFVPNRILWKDWEKFITGGEDGLDATLFPTMTEVPVNSGSLLDYLGVPQNFQGSAGIMPPISVLPCAAYQLIWNEYYRDQNFQEGIDVSEMFRNGNQAYNNHDAPQFMELFPLRKRAWQHDYFTSCLPWAQKGEPVRLPIGSSAPINFLYENVPNGVNGNPTQGIGMRAYTRDSNGNPIRDLGGDLTVAEGDTGRLESDARNVAIDVSAHHNVDLSEATASTITDLRRAFKLQEWLEKNARAGSRYIESILSHFGVKSSDARLQRPEFLGGGMSPVMISEVLQTAEGSAPVGEMAGHGLNLGGTPRFSKFFEEHGYVIGLMSVMPKTSYQQGIPRHFSKFDKFDYFWPEFQHIGEQEVKNKEIFAFSSNQAPEYDPEGTFGYNPRYSEYKFIRSSVHADFQNTLDFWHMGRIFDVTDPPNLNAEFIVSNPTTRIFAVENLGDQHLWCHLFHNIKANRKMSYYGDPSMRL